MNDGGEAAAAPLADILTGGMAGLNLSSSGRNQPKIISFDAAILNDIFHHNAATDNWSTILIAQDDKQDAFHRARRNFRNYC